MGSLIGGGSCGRVDLLSGEMEILISLFFFPLLVYFFLFSVI